MSLFSMPIATCSVLILPLFLFHSSITHISSHSPSPSIQANIQAYLLCHPHHAHTIVPHTIFTPCVPIFILCFISSSPPLIPLLTPVSSLISVPTNIPFPHPHCLLMPPLWLALFCCHCQCCVCSISLPFHSFVIDKRSPSLPPSLPHSPLPTQGKTDSFALCV